MARTYGVTGAAGLLGLSVLKLLAQEKADEVRAVKALDLYFPEDLKAAIESESRGGPKFIWITCDITKYGQVREAISGCDVVLHIASVIPGAFKDDKATMYQVNTSGAMNVTNACLENNVGKLVYVSSVSVVGPNDHREPAENLTEDTPYNSGQRTFYGQTKKIAEDFVLDANGKSCSNGEIIVTCAVRPGPIYGENFRGFEVVYRTAINKVVYSMQSSKARSTMIYVGNLASAVILAGKKLRNKKEVAGGQAYFVADYTEPGQGAEMICKMMSPLGYTISRQPVLPYPLNLIFYTIFFWINYLLRYLGLSQTSLPHPEEVWRWDVLFTQSGEKFAKHFSYKPLFSDSQSVTLVRQYVLCLNEIQYMTINLLLNNTILVHLFEDIADFFAKFAPTINILYPVFLGHCFLFNSML